MNVASAIRSRWLSAAVSAVLLAGCATKKPASPPPGLNLESRIRAGGLLDGPTTQPVDLSKREPLKVDIEWIALEKLPAGALKPVDTFSRLTVSPEAAVALLPSGQATRSIRFGIGSDAVNFVNDVQAGKFGRAVNAGSSNGWIAAGTTRQFEMSSGSTDAGRIWISINPLETKAPVNPTTQPARLAATECMISLAAFLDSESANPLPETAVLESVPCSPGTTLAILVPSKFKSPEWTAIAAIVRIHRTTADAEKELAAELQKATAPPATQPSVPSELAAALSALKANSSPRASMLFLANFCGAQIASDWALNADDESLAKMSSEVASAKGESVEGVRWLLDRSAVQSMAERAEKSSLAPELYAVLELHAGELARRPDALLDLLKSAQSSENLQQRLIGENMIALEDSSPAARVRAFDWLTARGRAPAGFDPLATAKARRAALDAVGKQ